MLELFIDYREKCLIRNLKDLNIELESKNLDVGDIQFIYNDIKV